MNNWLALSLTALGCWGLWGVFANLASRHLNAQSAMIWEVAGALVVAGVATLAVTRSGGLDVDIRGIAYAVLTGVFYTVGLGLVFLALTSSRAPDASGSVHAVLMITALYPLVASLLNFFLLDEALSTRELVAMPIAVVAVILLATEST